MFKLQLSIKKKRMAMTSGTSEISEMQQFRDKTMEEQTTVGLTTLMSQLQISQWWKTRSLSWRIITAARATSMKKSQQSQRKKRMSGVRRLTLSLKLQKN